MSLHHSPQAHLYSPDSRLSPEHLRTLTEGSGIGIQEVAESEARTILRGRDLPHEFSERQRRRGPGILFIGHRPNSKTACIFRADAADPEEPGRKYEQGCKSRGAPGNTLDIPPSLHHLIEDTSVPVIFTEGTKKMLALTSAAKREGVKVLVAGISGCWNWKSDGEPIADMLDIPVKGRSVTVCFDSDMLLKPEVQGACKALAEHLQERGARVFVTYFNDAPDGSKVGADDFLVAGGTFAELRLLTRSYDPADFARMRLSRDERLRLALEDLERRWWEFEWKGMGGYSARDVALKLIEAAKRHGKVAADGVRVEQAQGPLAIEAKISTRTLWKALNRLEEWGFLYRDNEGRKPDKTGAFVLRASVSHKGTEDGTQGTTVCSKDALYARDLHLRGELRCPRLRWSSPKYTPRRGVVRDTRRVRRSVRLEARDGIKRLGKTRGGIIDVLDAYGGSATLEEIGSALHHKRPRDIRRRNLPMLEEAGIITVDGDMVSLTENWLEALNAQRVLGKEIEADELAALRHRLKSQAFHNRYQNEADEAPTAQQMRESRESYPARRRQAIREAIERLFRERPEYRSRRVGQVTCALYNYLGPDFPRGPDGAPKDAEVEALLDGVAA